MPRLQFRHGHKPESGGPDRPPCPTPCMSTLYKLIQIDAPFTHFVLAHVHFRSYTQKRLTNDLPLACELHQEKEIYELVYEAKIEKQAINAHNVRVLSFYLTKTICDDKLKVTISDQGKC